MQLALSIDRKAETAIYKQIAEQIICQIENGTLSQGSRLPTVRDLADFLSVTRVTVHNAYNNLKDRGWIESTVGRGTFVATPSTPPDPTEVITGQITPEAILRDMHRLNHLPGMQSLAIAEPDRQLLPVNEFLQEIRGLKDAADTLFEYGCTKGESHLRQQLSSSLAQRGINAKPGAIQVTMGGTQALSLVTQALTEPGDKVLVEEPTYLGMLAILKAQRLQALGVPMDAEGPRLDVLEGHLMRERPRFFYTIPNFHNPTGVSMSTALRKDLYAIAQRFGLTIIEDDVYGALSFDAAANASLKADDPDDLVVYVDSFSKALLPGIRVGFVVAPPAIRERIWSLIQVTTLCGPQLQQRALAEFLRKGRFEQHLRRVLPTYRERRDALLATLEESMPPGVTWTEPHGGLCCWVSLPDAGNFDNLYRAALQHGVAYAPGEVFLAEPRHRISLRLCFGNQPAERIRNSVTTLARLIADRVDRAARFEETIPELTPVV